MKVQDYIITWMNEMVVKFPWISFKYEYSPSKNIYYVAVYPQSLVEANEEYCDDENNFAFELDDAFPDETILFGNEDVLFRCSDKALEIKAKDNCNDQSNILDSFEAIKTPSFLYKSKMSQNANLAGENNYALAA